MIFEEIVSDYYKGKGVKKHIYCPRCYFKKNSEKPDVASFRMLGDDLELLYKVEPKSNEEARLMRTYNMYGFRCLECRYRFVKCLWKINDMIKDYIKR